MRIITRAVAAALIVSGGAAQSAGAQCVDDPAETADVAADHPETVARLGALLESYQRLGRSHPPRT